MMSSVATPTFNRSRSPASGSCTISSPVTRLGLKTTGAGGSVTGGWPMQSRTLLMRT
ncbi:MAG: hypothetical protein BWX68_02585 [Verrucomicrobia bacterium ADurb.Bin063]|nr:MAG: hypothetical protein BWX68_02585 [Verrucomicrobia bacterium ADurb.Bin063]